MVTLFAEQPFVVVDLETTGGSALFDRVIEVACVRMEAGQVVERLETLVDPATGVPPFITRLTGITQAMLRGRPRLDALLPDLERLTRGAVVVAHNAAFDYAFLQAAFRRAGVAWQPQRLCTLRLARRLLRGLHSYKLDSLCAHLEIAQVQRHRAGPDCDATAALLAHLLVEADRHGMQHAEELLRFQEQPVTPKKRKASVDEAQVASLPTGPGVYLLKDAQGHIMYVGKSVNVRQRVRTHLRPSGTAHSPAQPRLRKRLPYVADVEAIETGSEIEALFLESKLVKRYLPDANRMLRDYRDYPFIKVDLADPHPRLEATRERPTETDGALFFGPFRSAGVAARTVLFLTEHLGLRQCSGALWAGMSACALLDLRKCAGPCVGAVDAAGYRERVERAVRILRGEDLAIFDDLAAQRDTLAEGLRFEMAAELRDRIRDLELIVGAQQRLRAVTERNLVIVARETDPGSAKLFLVKGGRIAREVVVSLGAPPATLREVLHAVFTAPSSGAVSRDEVDDMLILGAWLKRRGAGAAEVPVPSDAPEQAIPEIRAALAGLRAVGRGAEG